MARYLTPAVVLLALLGLPDLGRGDEPERTDGQKLLEALRQLKKGRTDLAAKLPPLPAEKADAEDAPKAVDKDKIKDALTSSLWRCDQTASATGVYVDVWEFAGDGTLTHYFSSGPKAKADEVFAEALRPGTRYSGGRRFKGNWSIRDDGTVDANVSIGQSTFYFTVKVGDGEFVAKQQGVATGRAFKKVKK
jgi:hypothetical protein